MKLALALAVGVVLATLVVQASSAGLRTSGTKILDARGAPLVLRGINYPHSWFKGESERGLRRVAHTGANAVRIVLSDGGQYVRDDENTVKWLLNLCRQLQMVAILEVHDATGSDDVKTLERAADYWVSVAGVLKGHEDSAVINVANEWHGSSGKAAEWARGYQAVLPRLRQAGLSHLLLVDAPGWGQDAAAIAQQGRAVLQADPLRNTAFSIHMYEVAGANADTIRRNIEGSLATGAPVVVGEFGNAQNGKPVDYHSILDYCHDHAVGWLAWSWFGNNKDTASLDMAYGSTGHLTPWGHEIVKGKHGLRKEAKKANGW